MLGKGKIPINVSPFVVHTAVCLHQWGWDVWLRGLVLQSSQMSLMEACVDLGKETQKLFFSQKCILHAPGKYQLRSSENLNLIEGKYSIISVYSN